jgi:hypothetical protein
MAATNWDERLADLERAREEMLAHPIRNIAAVEELVEGAWREIRKNPDMPSKFQFEQARQVLKDIHRLSIHGAEMVDGWRLALESAAGEYGPGGAPESELFKSSRMSRLG